MGDKLAEFVDQVYEKRNQTLKGCTYNYYDGTVYISVAQ